MTNPKPITIYSFTSRGKPASTILYPFVDQDGNLAYANRQGRRIPNTEITNNLAPIHENTRTSQNPQDPRP